MRYFPLYDAIKLPVIVYRNVVLYKMGGALSFDSPLTTGMFQIGSKNISIIGKNQKTIWDCQGEIHIKNKAFVGIGGCLSIGKKGSLYLGDNFILTARSTIDCQKSIRFGDDCLLSWDILIMDSDYHQITNENGVVINMPKEIEIGNHVWIGCRCTVLKGTVLPDNTIVAAGTVISSKLYEPNAIIGGCGKNISILKTSVTWSK